ncbi:hypothetical protein [uncultured Georgenia sp.]|uniref:hypothetical protein n=1 Tax=uncultured Georgenia sp. TaxID=378209 RepID=UPI002621EF5A|nr:hypothetical protein [uncultured Georgenia sp.]HLV05463.1 hypothetical protein [Actinomycetaceae bacterium]
MTWWLWLVLVLAALALFAVLGVRLWRKGKALLTELQALTELGERLADIAGTEPPEPFVPAYLAPPGALAAARDRREDNLRARRERRAARAEQALSRWQRLGLR